MFLEVGLWGKVKVCLGVFVFSVGIVLIFILSLVVFLFIRLCLNIFMFSKEGFESCVLF